MAWRIDEWVIRGEIDNRVRGRVTGRIWFTERAEPEESDADGRSDAFSAGRDEDGDDRENPERKT